MSILIIYQAGGDQGEANSLTRPGFTAKARSSIGLM